MKNPPFDSLVWGSRTLAPISVSSREQQSIRIGLGLGQVLENSRVAIRPEVLFTQYIFYFSNKAVVSKFIVSQARPHQDTAENSTFF